MPICGPKCSLCCSVLSVWGIIQLGLMGVFFYFHSVAFVEDLPVQFDEESNKSVTEKIQQFHEDVDSAYTQSAYNCWIAAGIYTGLLAFSLQQFYANRR